MLLDTSGELRPDESINSGKSSLPMPTAASAESESDSGSDNERDASLVLERNIVSSTASLEPLERLEALQRRNTDLGRKLMEAERTGLQTTSQNWRRCKESWRRCVVS